MPNSCWRPTINVMQFVHGSHPTTTIHICPLIPASSCALAHTMASMAIAPVPQRVPLCPSRPSMIRSIRDAWAYVRRTTLAILGQWQHPIRSVCKVRYLCYIDCPTSTYADYNSSRCVIECPVGTYYMDGTKPNCTARCPTNYYGHPTNRTCMQGGTCPTTSVPFYADDTTNLCVMNCPANYFADTTTGRCLVYCSNNYFGDSSSGVGICVLTCPDTYYRDNVTRKCLRVCPEGQFINVDAGNCTSLCPTDFYGDNVTKKCVD